MSIKNNYAQKVVLDAEAMHNLDTIIYIKSICRNDPNLRGFTFCKSSNEDILLNYYNNQIHGDTFRVFKLQFPSNRVDSFDLIVKNGKDEFRNGIMSFDVLDSKVVILLSNSILVLDIINSKRIQKCRSLKFENGEVYQSVSFISLNTILLSRSYNYKRQNSDFQKTKLSLVDIKSLKTLKTISPNVSIIELSHMKPYSTISTSNNKILIGQNNKYKFEVFDLEFNLQNEFYMPKKFENCNLIDSLEIEKINRISGSNSSTIIKYLQPKFHLGAAFVDGYFSMDDDNAIIRYTFGENRNDTFSRMFDILRYNSIRQNYIISDTSYLIKSPWNHYNELLSNDLIDKQNYFIDFWLNQSLFSLKNTFVFSKGTNEYPIGLKRTELDQKEIEFYKNNHAVFTITVLKNQY